MSKTFYLASAISNLVAAKQLIAELAAQGWTCVFDWTMYFNAENEASDEAKAKIAEQEVNAVTDCDVFVMFLPAGRGGHLEMGVALATGKPVLLMYSDWEKDAAGGYAYSCIFYFMTEVTRFRYPVGQPEAAAVALAMDRILEKALREVEESCG